MESKSTAFACFLGILMLLPALAMAQNTPPVTSQGDVIGTVKTRDGEDICAIVLASGQHTFSCDPVGSYFLRDIPSEPDGTVKRQIYARGFFPKVDVLQRSEEESVTVGRVTLNRASGCPDYNLPSDPLTFPPSSGKRHSVSGRVLLQSTDTPVCAFVLANGSYMFSCDGEGSFSLDFPLDENGQYTLQSYADGFAPSVRVFNEFDNPQEVRMARASECEHPDDTVVAAGKEWLQPDLFEDYTRDQIAAVCPGGACSGTLPGSSVNLTGYRWATVEDLNALFNYYIGTDEMGPGEEFYIGEPRSLDAFVLDGWRLIDSDENSPCPSIIGGLRNGQAFVCDDGPHPLGGKGDYFVTAIEYANGGWFWRPAE